MAIPVALRVDFKASQLRGLARKTKDGPQARRLLALAAIYDGATRTEAARIGGVGLQIIRDWVMRFNARGAAGLLDGKSPGQAVKNSLTVVRHDSRLVINGNSDRKDQPWQTWKRQFANVPTTSGSPMVNQRATRTSIG